MSRRVRPDILLVTALVAVQAVVQLLVRPNPRWNDGIFVLGYAKHFPDVPANHFTLRIGLLLPTRLFESIFGYGQVSYYAFPFLCSLLLVGATYFVGKELFGRWAGCIAALLTVLNPLLVETANFPGTGVERMTSWQLLPDIPSTAVFTLGLALLLCGVRRAASGPTGRIVSAPGWLLGAGLCFGYAYLIRETIPFLFPVIVVVLLFWRVAWRSWLWVAGAMAGCFVAELAINAGVYGDALARFKAGSEQGGAPVHPLTRVKVLEQFVNVIREYPATAAWVAAVLLTVVTPLLVRRRPYFVPAVWAGLHWTAMVLLSGVLSPGHIIVQGQLPRYWVPLSPALALGAAGGLRAAWSALTTRVTQPVVRSPAFAAVATAAVLALFFVPVASDITDNPRDHTWNAVRSYLHAHDADVPALVIDDRDARTLSVYRVTPTGGHLAWHARVVVVRHFLGNPPDPSPGQWLLWTGQLSKRPPAAGSGWTPVLNRPGLGLYSATGTPVGNP